MKNGYDEVLFLNENGLVTEGSISNIFLVKGNIIYTPKAESGLLPGVVRNFIIDEFNVIEKEIVLDDLFNADEIFITNSLLGVMKISKLEDKIFEKNKITIAIREKYEEIISN